MIQLTSRLLGMFLLSNNFQPRESWFICAKCHPGQRKRTLHLALSAKKSMTITGHLPCAAPTNSRKTALIQIKARRFSTDCRCCTRRRVELGSFEHCTVLVKQCTVLSLTSNYVPASTKSKIALARKELIQQSDLMGTCICRELAQDTVPVQRRSQDFPVICYEFKIVGIVVAKM